MAIDRFGSGPGIHEWTRKMHDIMDEMLRRTFVHYRHTGSWQPAMNVYATRDTFHICVDLAGMDETQIDVRCADDRRVTLSGERPGPRPPNVEGPYSVEALEIDEGAFRREIELPEPIVTATVEASYCKGYLWITLSKARST